MLPGKCQIPCYNLNSFLFIKKQKGGACSVIAGKPELEMKLAELPVKPWLQVSVSISRFGAGENRCKLYYRNKEKGSETDSGCLQK